MTEPTEAARQRCADLANEHTASPGQKPYEDGHFLLGVGVPTALAFANHVQDTHDKASEIVRMINDYRNGDYVSLPKLEGIARAMMLPEPNDELVEALECALWDVSNVKLTDRELATIANIIRKVGE